MGQVARKFEVVEGGSAIVPLRLIEEPIGEPLRNPEKWLPAADLADLADVSERMARKAISGGRWRGADLIVRQVEVGRGGAGGMAPQVHVDSLPADLREAWYLAHGIELHRAVDTATGETRLVPGADLKNDPKWEERTAIARWRLDVIRPLLQQPKGSPARKALAEELAGRPIPQMDGKPKRVSRATIYGWLSAYDKAGLAGLMPSVRKDKGKARIVVSEAWDGFFAPRIAAADHQRIGDEVTHYIRSLWAAGASGWRTICDMSTTRLIELSRDLRDVSFDTLPLGSLSDASGAPTQFGICAVSAYTVRRERQYKVIAIRDKDNARYQDTIAPTIRRDYGQLKPREIIVGDVHPMDIMIRRPNGRAAYPKAISWFDPSTGEIHMTIILLEEGEGVRREHIATSFEGMVAEWGLPRLLYLDNGSEYGDPDLIDGFTALSKLVGMTVKENSFADARVRAGREAVVRSLAYNAKGKPGIEGLFGNLEKVFFSHVEGWTAGDRMRKKTHAKGRDPIPFSGALAELVETVRLHLDHYHRRPARESRKSPNERLRDHIAAGWGKVAVSNPDVLSLAFSAQIERVPDRGCISYAARDGRSRRYFLDKLLGLLPGTKVTARVPAYDPQFLFVFGEDGEFLGLAYPEQTYHPLDPAGAQEGGARNKFLRRYLRDQSRHVALLDLTDEARRHIGHLPEAPSIPVSAVVDAGMLDRAVLRAAEERARLSAPETTPRRTPSQWGTGENAVLAAFEFESDEGEQ